MSRIDRIFPIAKALRGYRREDLGGDLSAGLTTAVMLIPQGMGYAMLAGLPPIYGLYASTVPLVIYALFGTSRQLAVGPVAMVSLLSAAGVGALAQAGTSEFVSLAILLALVVGAIQVAMGVFRVGFVVNFLSHPVISGFTSAAALIIGFSQLKHLLGVPIPRSHHVHEILIKAAEQISSVHVSTVVIGASSVVALMLMKRYSPRFPRALAVVVVSSLAVWLLGLDSGGVSIVGKVPAGLPSLTLPKLDWAAMSSLLPVALTIALVGFMESIAVAKKYARINGYEVDANSELVGLGMANVLGGFFQGYAVTGGFSRTAVNAQAGARTPIAAIVTASVVALTLLFLTPLFYFLPNAVLAAIIMTAVFGLIDVKEMRHLWHVKKTDFAMLAITFLSTLSLGIEQGIIVGVVASIGVIVVRTTRPHVAVLGRLPGTDVYRNVKRFPEAEITPGVLAIRLDAQFYFGNVNFLKEVLSDLEHGARETIKAVVIDASGINQLDSSAEMALRDILEDYRKRGIELFLANVKGPVRDVLERSGLDVELGSEHTPMEIAEAMRCAARVAKVAAPTPPALSLVAAR